MALGFNLEFEFKPTLKAQNQEVLQLESEVNWQEGMLLGVILFLKLKLKAQNQEVLHWKRRSIGRKECCRRYFVSLFFYFSSLAGRRARLFSICVGGGGGIFCFLPTIFSTFNRFRTQAQRQVWSFQLAINRKSCNRQGYRRILR